MKLYTLSTGCYSDFMEWKLTHDNIISVEEFNNMVVECCNELKDKDDYVGYGSEIVALLIKKHGFKTIQYINCHAFDYSHRYGKDEFPATSIKKDIID